MKRLTKGQRRVLLRALNGHSLPPFSHIVNKLKEKGLLWGWYCGSNDETVERALRNNPRQQKRRRRKNK